MKKKFMIIIAVIAILLIALIAIVVNKRNASLAIIGGADGPTTIFLAGTLGNEVLFPAILIGILLLVLGIIFSKKIKRNINNWTMKH